jgi:triacylglycerol lipase
MNPPLPHIYDADNARLLCRASERAYGLATAPGETGIWDSASDTHVLILDTGGDLIIAFRGTRDLRNWLTDLDIRWCQDGAWRVHDGFSRCVESVMDGVSSAVFAAGYKSKRLWVTGHSLGGALAKLYAARVCRGMVENPFSGLYTFGQPRVGNAKFRDDCTAFFGACYFRLIHADDIVPRVPWLLGGYRHAGHEVFFPDLQGAPKFDLPWPRKFVADIPGLVRELCYDRAALIEDHHIHNYLALFQEAA